MAEEKKLIDISDQEIEAIYNSGKEATVSFIRVLIDKINELAITVEKQQQEINQLKAVINKDSHNSNKPPSSDNPYKKQRTKSLRKKGGKIGGQFGHEGSNLKQTLDPDYVQKLNPHGKCICGKNISQAIIIGKDIRQVFDLPEIKIQVTEYQSPVLKCECGKTHRAIFPSGINSKTQYGNNLKAFVVYLKHYGLMSYERIEDLIEDFLGQNISQGTLVNMVQDCAKNIKPFTELIKNALIDSKIVHFDETGFRIDGTLNWLHSAGNQDFTYYHPHKARGVKAMNDMGILPFFKGIAVHDHWESYFSYNLCSHSLCNSHHLRELIFFSERDEKWADKIIKCLLDAKDEKNQNLHFSDERKKYYRSKLLRLLNEALKIHPEMKKTKKTRGRQKQSQEHNLLSRMKNRINDVLRFVFEHFVPFDNNLAERDIRMTKVQQKISGTFRSLSGAYDFCAIRSYISTARKQGNSVFESILKSFNNQMIISLKGAE